MLRVHPWFKRLIGRTINASRARFRELFLKAGPLGE
jgi:hypothetical protein